MLRSTRLLAVFALWSGVACGSREFSAREEGGTAGSVQAGAGRGAGSGGRAGSGGSSKGGSGAGTPGSTGGSHSSGASAGTSQAAGGTGNSGSAAEGGTGEGGEDASGGTSGASGGGNSNGGTSAGSGTGATGGVPAAGSAGDGGSEAGGAPGSGGSSGAGLSGNGGSSAGTTGNAGASAGGSGGELGGCDNQLLANADFDAGPKPAWRQESDVEGLEIIVHRDDSALKAAGVAPFSGDYLAWLGGIEDDKWDRHDVILRQDVTIPAGASRLTLSGRYWIQTEDSPTVAYDVSYLEFEDDEGVIWQARYLDNTDTTTGWTSFEHETTSMQRFAGRTVTFVAYSRTDLTGKTSFFLDSLHLEAACGR